ncbi:MAG: GTP cyclohydrolase II [Alphaproteobacteria bacterium]
MQEKPDSITKAHLFTGRAVDQLRRQLPIVLEEDNGKAIGIYPLEGLTENILLNLKKSSKNYSLLLTSIRAKWLGLESDNPHIALIPAQNMTFTEIQTCADPLVDEKIYSGLTLLPTTSTHATAMRLTKHASLLPALLLIEDADFPTEWLRVSTHDVGAYWASPPMDIVPVTQASLPIKGAEKTKLICFRDRFGTSTHLTLIIGDALTEDAPLTRIHSSCVTGDILGSLRCDCCSQLQLSIAQMVKQGSGILVYLHQEGRGIGIANKLRAYALQERGIDTYDANLMLGFGEDERDFSIAAEILKSLGKTRISLLTNNPRKIENIKSYGIAVADRVPVVIPAGAHNQEYLNAKVKKSGHLF